MQQTFREMVCQQYGIPENRFIPFVVRKCVFKRALILRPVVLPFHPDVLFQERRMVELAGRCTTLKEIQYEIDFYQHKYVVNSFIKDALKFRASGMRLMRFAKPVFHQAKNSSAAPAA